MKCLSGRSGRSGTNGIVKENIKITIPNAGSVNKMDNKTIQLDFKLLVIMTAFNETMHLIKCLFNIKRYIIMHIVKTMYLFFIHISVQAVAYVAR